MRKQTDNRNNAGLGYHDEFYAHGKSGVNLVRVCGGVIVAAVYKPHWTKQRLYACVRPGSRNTTQQLIYRVVPGNTRVLE